MNFWNYIAIYIVKKLNRIWARRFMSEEVFNNYGKWKAIIHQCYGKKFAALARRLWMDVWCVVNGIKPAWLVDYLPLDESKLYRLIEESALGGILMLQQNSLAILTLNSDLLLINASSLVNCTTSDLPTLVNITEKLEQPSVIPNCMWESIASTTSTIQSIQSMVTAGPAGKLFTVHLTVPDHVNLCSVFGWLLGYPVVYWFDSTAHCTMEQLLCFSARVSTNLVSWCTLPVPQIIKSTFKTLVLKLIVWDVQYLIP